MGRGACGRGRDDRASWKWFDARKRCGWHGDDAYPVAGERNQLVYIPLGVCAVIPPWNLPFAITAGDDRGGHRGWEYREPKPSSESPTIAARFLDVREEAGMPPGVVKFCPGSGRTFGNAIVEDPKTRRSPLPGPRKWDVDIHVGQRRHDREQIWDLKRTILEMGGKDSIIVSNDCDLDAAVVRGRAPVRPSASVAESVCSTRARIVEDSVYDVSGALARPGVETLKAA